MWPGQVETGLDFFVRFAMTATGTAWMASGLPSSRMSFTTPSAANFPKWCCSN
jgi:hypothetical protein